MTPKVCIVDTNVIVSGLLGADSNSPPARILDAMLAGTLLHLMSERSPRASIRTCRAARVSYGCTDGRMTKSIGCLPAWSPMGCVASPPSRATPPTPGTTTCGRCSRAVCGDNWPRVTGCFWNTLLAMLLSRPLVASSVRFFRRERADPHPGPVEATWRGRNVHGPEHGADQQCLRDSRLRQRSG